MVYPVHWLFRIEGTFNDGVTVLEQWSNTVRFKAAGEFAVDPEQWLLDHGAPGAALLYGTNMVSSSCRVAALKLNEVGPDGRYTDTANTHVVYPGDFSPIAGLSTTYVEPQRTLAISLTTDFQRGPAHRGRIYLPGFVAAVSSTLGVGTGSLDPIAASAKAALEEWNEDPSLDAAVVSRLGSGTFRLITGVEVGNRVDTQRRRRRSLPEIYVSQSLGT